MKIEYDTTIDEMVTTQMLWLRGTNTVEKWQAWGVFYWSAIMFLIVYFGNGSLISKSLAGFVVGGVIGGRMVFDPKSMIKKRIRKILVKKLGSESSIPSTVQITEDKFEYSSNNSNISFHLKDLSEIEEVDDGLLLNFTQGNINYIPDSAFQSDAEKIKWKNLLDEFCRKNT